MKRHLIFAVCGMGLFISSLQAQLGTVSESGNTDMKMTVDVRDSKIKARNNVTGDESETLNVTGIGGSVFTVSNQADGTDKSYDHNLRVVLSLNLAENKTEKYQLVFYSEGEKLPFAVASEISTFSVYYPISMYESIRQKLEQSLAARKKVQLKVIRKADGYREGTLIF
ncbi:MAG TPA: hypothetical protein VEB63_06540 [Chitinophagaceae bacterium]|nr:hypothetical protein [Chitinophagaceae bacterium]